MTNPDLHLHTHYSDGKESPAAVVRRAAAMGIDVMAITDHDGMGGVAEAVAEGLRLGVKVIPGVEFSAQMEDEVPGIEPCVHYMHILGYGQDMSSEKLKGVLDRIREKRRLRNEALRKQFEKLGYGMTMEELESHSVNGFVGKVAFARLLAKKGACRDAAEAFSSKELLSHPDVKAIHRYKISAREAIETINEAGGKAFLAHPFQLSARPRLSEPDEAYRRRIEAVCSVMKGMGMAGVECYYPTHTPEETQFLSDMASRLGLLVSKGSDDHGRDARPVKRMGNFSVQADLSVLEWVKEYI